MKSLCLTCFLLACAVGLVQAQAVPAGPMVTTVTVVFKTTDLPINNTSQVEVQLLTVLNVLVADHGYAAITATTPFSSLPLNLVKDPYRTPLSELHNAKLNIVMYPQSQLKWTFDFDVKVTFDDHSTRVYNFYGAKVSPDNRTYSVMLP